jgi:hypothetical protein
MKGHVVSLLMQKPVMQSLRTVVTVSLCVFIQACTVNYPAPDAGSRGTTRAPAPGKVVDSRSPSSPLAEPEALPERSSKKVSPLVSINRVTPVPAALNLLAKADQSLQGGDVDGALLWLERAQRLSPNAGEVYLAMADAKARLGLWQDAEQLCLKALSLAGNDTAFKKRAQDKLAWVKRRHS